MTGPVVFEGSVLAAGPVTGVGRAFLTTLDAYTAIAEDEVVLLLPPGTPPPDLPRLRLLRTGPGTQSRQIRLPRVLRHLAPRLRHSPVAAAGSSSMPGINAQDTEPPR